MKAEASGAGFTLSVNGVRTANVPNERVSSLQKSYPATFYTPRPPPLNGVPRPSTALMPIT
jgi:hypothetical protein